MLSPEFPDQPEIPNGIFRDMVSLGAAEELRDQACLYSYISFIQYCERTIGNLTDAQTFTHRLGDLAKLYENDGLQTPDTRRIGQVSIAARHGSTVGLFVARLNLSPQLQASTINSLADLIPIDLKQPANREQLDKVFRNAGDTYSGAINLHSAVDEVLKSFNGEDSVAWSDPSKIDEIMFKTGFGFVLMAASRADVADNLAQEAELSFPEIPPVQDEEILRFLEEEQK